MSKPIWVLLGVLLVGCVPASPPAESGAGAPAAETARVEPADPSPDEQPAAPAVPAQGRYTTLSGAHCRSQSAGDEISSTRTVCDGVSPYRLAVTDSDGRQELELIEGEGEPQSLELGRKVSIGFSELGDTVEWWPMEEVAPTALIVRFNAQDEPDQPERVTSSLVVVKLAGSGSCVTEVIAPAAEQNRLAREAAARAANAPCADNRY
ncbi:hypothetical protein [Luteimonas sp. e5]